MVLRVEVHTGLRKVLLETLCGSDPPLLDSQVSLKEAALASWDPWTGSWLPTSPSSCLFEAPKGTLEVGNPHSCRDGASGPDKRDWGSREIPHLATLLPSEATLLTGLSHTRALAGAAWKLLGFYLCSAYGETEQGSQAVEGCIEQQQTSMPHPCSAPSAPDPAPNGALLYKHGVSSSMPKASSYANQARPSRILGSFPPQANTHSSFPELRFTSPPKITK